jgi:hypothetical protein
VIGELSTLEFSSRGAGEKMTNSKSCKKTSRQGGRLHRSENNVSFVIVRALLKQYRTHLAHRSPRLTKAFRQPYSKMMTQESYGEENAMYMDWSRVMWKIMASIELMNRSKKKKSKKKQNGVGK